MSRFFKGGDDETRHDRSVDERERARAEREARRGGREGGTPLDDPPAPAEPVAAATAEGPGPADGAGSASPEWFADDPGPDAAAPESPPPLADRSGPSEVAAPESPLPLADRSGPSQVAAPESLPPLADVSGPPVEVVPHEPGLAPGPLGAPAVPESGVDAPESPTLAASTPPPPTGPPASVAMTRPQDIPEPLPDDAPRRRGRADRDEPPSVVVTGRPDEPAGLKRVRGSALASAAGAEGMPRFGAPPRGVPRRRPVARRLGALLLVVLLAAIAYFAYRLFQPGKGDGTGRVALRVPAGATAAEIGDLLAAKGVVDSSFFFSLRSRLSGDRSKLRSGAYTLRRDMSYGAALTALTKAPPAAPKLAKLTIPEGPSRRENVQRVKDAGVKGSYLAATKRSAALAPRSYGAPKGATLEGFLFPATYDLKPDATARSLVAQQLRAFKRAFAKVDMRAAKRKKLTRFDVLTISSMVEREAGVEKDRRLIAGVIYNRLAQGMPLGIDATIRYELGNFSQPLKQSELTRDTPYNTRTRTGLPPGPIGNPGLASLQAAAHPAQNGFLFYVVKPCGKGAHAFSSTNAKFLQDVAAYNAKRDQLGGKDPSQC